MFAGTTGPQTPLGWPSALTRCSNFQHGVQFRHSRQTMRKVEEELTMVHAKATSSQFP